jgi:hyperosmotically inducible periplasmic protein
MKMNKPIIVLAMSLILCGAYSFALSQDSSTFSPDNSGLNVRDRSSGAVTADSQPNSKDDLELTARIRRAIMSDRSLSTMAQNIKVISANGQVTLRGPVRSDQERTAIASDVHRVVGVNNVDNRLEVVSQ